MKNKTTIELKAIITVATLIIFELVFVGGEVYEVISEWIRYYSRTITLGLGGIIAMGIIIAVNGFSYKNEKEQTRIPLFVIISAILIVFFVFIKVKSIWF